jgi:hypothetical protein
VPTYGRRYRQLDGISQQPNTSFCLVIGSTTISSSFKDDTWCHWDGGAMFVIFFSSQPTLLFSPFENRVGHAKFQSCPLIYWDVKFIIFFIFYFLFLVLLWNLELFVILFFNPNLWYVIIFNLVFILLIVLLFESFF